MNRLLALFVLCFIMLLVGFSTWQFYAGNLTAGMSTLPFLAIAYLFVINQRRGRKDDDGSDGDV